MKTQILLLAALASAIVASVQTPQPAVSTQTASAGSASPQPVVIQVTDSSSATVPVSGALVRVAPVPDNQPGSVQTDSRGQLSLQLKPGRYGIVIAAQGFSTYNAHFDVASGGATQTVSVKLRLAATGSPMVVTEGRPPDPHLLTLTISPFADSFSVTEDILKGLPRKSVVMHNPHSNTDEKYEGVLVADLLAKYAAPFGKDLRGPALANYVLATGADGYKVVYSLAELDPAFHPGDVILADTMDGKPLDAHTGPFRLVSTEDKRPARGVRNLVSIEVKSAQ